MDKMKKHDGLERQIHLIIKRYVKKLLYKRCVLTSIPAGNQAVSKATLLAS